MGFTLFLCGLSIWGPARPKVQWSSQWSHNTFQHNSLLKSHFCRIGCNFIATGPWKGQRAFAAIVSIFLILMIAYAGCLCSCDAQQWMGATILRSDWLESSCRHRGWEIVITGKAGGGEGETAAFVRVVDSGSHFPHFQERCIRKVTAIKEIFIRRDLSVSLWILTHLIRHHSLSDMKVTQASKCLG